MVGAGFYAYAAVAAGPGNEFNDLKPQPFFVKKTDSTPRPTR